jgi:Rad3-related DNA helicase
MVSLLSPQTQILRDYAANYAEKSDVAFQLPTGSGKTLIGVVLGEWRRRKNDERVVYLCPTRQLVHQVVEQSRGQYGVEATPFVGSRKDFSQSAKGDYRTSESIAVATYSALFNTNPFFDEPHVIILDDIHAAEDHISDMWTVRITHQQHEAIFENLAEIIGRVLEPHDRRKLRGEARLADSRWIDKLPTPKLYKIRNELSDLLNDQLSDSSDSNQKYAWACIKDHVDACHLYLSPSEILIRPLIPPTFTHAPFADAGQRIYMSATLGSGGDLERITGRRSIDRMSPPPDWEKQGIGRRYFFFPERSVTGEDLGTVALESMKQAGRSLVLVPSGSDASKWEDLIDDKIGYPTFSASQIETSKEPFVAEDKAVAVIANRYDGIDFPEDDCRFIILWRLPRAVHLQERFIIECLGASTTLQDRITTRIVQAFGRCTRKESDYAAVLVAGGEIDDYLLKSDKRQYFHPEIQAELKFGIDQSKDREVKGFIENVEVFFQQGDEWRAADGRINQIRENCEQQQFPGREDLESAVRDEIRYLEAMWRRDFPAAVEACRNVITALDEPELRGYRALWNYLAGSASWIAAERGQANLSQQAKEFFSTAGKASGNLPWLSQLAMGTDSEPSDHASTDSRCVALVERMEREIERMGTATNQKFDAEIQEIRSLLSRSDDGIKFERGHERLGALLGFESGNSDEDGDPDPWWVVDSGLVFVFEDYTEADPDKAVPLHKARQVFSHPQWIRNNLEIYDDAQVVPILITAAQSVESSATSPLENVFVWPRDEFRDWAWRAIETVEDLRTRFPGPADAQWRQEAVDAYAEAQICPNHLLDYLQSRKALDILDPA